MSNYVYIVEGWQDDGECITKWNVIAFTDESCAKNYADKANAENKKLQAKKDKLFQRESPNWWEKFKSLKNKLDSVMDGNDCNGYRVVPVWLGLNVFEVPPSTTELNADEQLKQDLLADVAASIDSLEPELPTYEKGD